MTRYFHEFLPLECYDPCDPWILREVERVHILRDQDSLFEHCQVCPLCGRTKPKSPVRSKPPPPKPLPLPADRPWAAQSALEHEPLPPSPALKEQSHKLNCNASGSAVIKLKSPPRALVKDKSTSPPNAPPPPPPSPPPSPPSPPSPRNAPFPVTPPRSKHSRPPSTKRSPPCPPSQTPKLTQQTSCKTSPPQDYASSQYRPEPQTGPPERVQSGDLQHESVPSTRRPSSPPLNRRSRQNIQQDAIPPRISPGKHLRTSTSSGAQYKSLKSASTKSPPNSTLRSSPGQMTPCASPLLQRCIGSRRSDPDMWRSNFAKFIQSLRPSEPPLAKNHPESSLCRSEKIPFTDKPSKSLEPSSRVQHLSADGRHPKERSRGQPDSASDPVLFPRPPSPPSPSSRRRPNQPPWPPQTAASGLHVNTDSNAEPRISESQSTPAVSTAPRPPKSPTGCDQESSLCPLSQQRDEQLETKECKQQEAKEENGSSKNESKASDSSSLGVVEGTVETVEKTVEAFKPSRKERQGRRRGAAWRLAMAWRLPVVQGMAPSDLEVAQEAQER